MQKLHVYSLLLLNGSFLLLTLVLICLYQEGKQVEGAVWHRWLCWRHLLCTSSHNCHSALESPLRSRSPSSCSMISHSVQSIRVQIWPLNCDTTPNNDIHYLCCSGDNFFTSVCGVITNLSRLLETIKKFGVSLWGRTMTLPRFR